MSRELLLDLNGNRNGRLRAWLDRFEGTPRIAWYPSAGQDMRDLLYLSPQYASRFPGTEPDPRCPDIFLHTDYFPWRDSTFLDSYQVHDDGRTSVRIAHIEQLPRLDLPLDRQLVHIPEGSSATGRVVFLELDVRSNLLGQFTVPLIYAFVENSAFCALKLLPNRAAISHLIHVRYGGGVGGGGSASGIWLLNVLRQLKCECLVSDGHYYRQDGDERAYQLYPALRGFETSEPARTIRTVASQAWSGHGDVSWQVLALQEN
jgi:hypothetical protein